MIIISAETTLRCTRQKLEKALLQLDQIYHKYCPEEHIVCKYIKGNPITPGSVLYFQEYIAGRKHTMRYLVSSTTENDSTATATLQAMFPRSIFGVKVVFEFKESINGIHFTRNIKIGDFENRLLCKLISIFSIAISKSNYFKAMKEHNQDDIEKLKVYIETKF